VRRGLTRGKTLPRIQGILAGPAPPGERIVNLTNNRRRGAMTPTPRIPVIAGAGLIGAPLVLLIARTLNVPWPGDSGVVKTGRYVQQIAADPTRSDLGAALVVLGAILLLPAVLHLGTVARTRTPRLGAVAMTLTVIGCVGIANVGAVSAIDGQIVRHSPTLVAVEVTRQYNENLPIVDAPILLGVLGFILLAICLFRSRRIPRAAAVLIGLGGAATAITSEGPIRPLLLAAAGILLIGQGWLVVAAHPAADPQTSEQPTEAATHR
jgi:hypothetical protein